MNDHTPDAPNPAPDELSHFLPKHVSRDNQGRCRPPSAMRLAVIIADPIHRPLRSRSAASKGEKAGFFSQMVKPEVWEESRIKLHSAKFFRGTNTSRYDKPLVWFLM